MGEFWGPQEWLTDLYIPQMKLQYQEVNQEGADWLRGSSSGLGIWDVTSHGEENQ